MRRRRGSGVAVVASSGRLFRYRKRGKTGMSWKQRRPMTWGDRGIEESVGGEGGSQRSRDMEVHGSGYVRSLEPE